MPKIKALSDKELNILDNFYREIRELVKDNFLLRESDLDMETFHYIISLSTFQPREYIKIFHSIPKYAQINILKCANIKSEDDLKDLFKKKINIYNQEIRR